VRKSLPAHERKPCVICFGGNETRNQRTESTGGTTTQWLPLTVQAVNARKRASYRGIRINVAGHHDGKCYAAFMNTVRSTVDGAGVRSSGKYPPSRLPRWTNTPRGHWRAQETTTLGYCHIPRHQHGCVAIREPIARLTRWKDIHRRRFVAKVNDLGRP
jgi:hypothetical protein